MMSTFLWFDFCNSPYSQKQNKNAWKKSELHAKYKVCLFRQEFILFMKFMPCNMCVYMSAV